MIPVELSDIAVMTSDRESRALEAMKARGKDLADLSESEFEAGLQRLETVKARMMRILDVALVKDAHYGNPKDKNGREAFKKPILYQAGAQELRRLMRLNVSRTKDDEIISTPEYCQAVVTLGIYDSGGRYICERKGACSSVEKRFKRFDGKGWIYDDAREVLHVVVAMAEKRAAGLLTLEASGATAFLANGEEMQDALAEDEKPISPWSDEEKKQCYAAAAKRGVGRDAFAALVLKTLGRATVGSEDVPRVLAAIAAWTPETKGDEQEDDGA